MAGNEISIKDFIASIEQHPIIWDVYHENYKNKVAKMNTWDAILEAFVPNYRNMSDQERKAVFNKYLRKWKSFRNCYTREKALQKKEPKTERKIYAFYNELRFLDKCGNHDSILVPNIPKQETEEPEETQNSEELNEDILHEYDGDKLFLLSLFDDLNKLPENMKESVKQQMLGVVTSAQQACLSMFSQQISSSFVNDSVNENDETMVSVKSEPDYDASLSGDDYYI